MKPSFSRRQALATLAAAASPWVHAQSKWPAKPIRVVVPFGAGGVADLTAREIGRASCRERVSSVV